MQGMMSAPYFDMAKKTKSCQTEIRLTKICLTKICQGEKTKICQAEICLVGIHHFTYRRPLLKFGVAAGCKRPRVPILL